MRFGLVLATVVMAGLLASAVAATGNLNQFAGVDSCKKCHAQEVEAWQNSPHARAHKALPADKQADPRCVQCHGSQQAGVAGVHCENCHGAGKHYAKRYVMKDPVLSRIVGLVDVSEKVCGRCHTETSPAIRTFAWDRMWGVIQHGKKTEPEK